jgi:enoyl-CoA hydratase
VPDMHFHAWLVGMRMGMEMMLTGDSISGTEAAQLGWATRAYPADQLEAKVVEMAERIAQLPPDLVQLNKRLVHRQMEMMGMRTALRVGTELCALGTHQKSMHEFIARVRSGGLTTALQERDQPFGDYRTQEPK